MAVAHLASVSLDCDDPLALGTFWASMLGGEVAFTSDEFVAVKTDRGWVAAVQIPDYRAPSWPGGDLPKQMHLDLAVTDLDAAQSEAIGLGAVLADQQPAPDRYRVLFDPAGHPFCLTTQIPE
jgi:hypothetical protein